MAGGGDRVLPSWKTGQSSRVEVTLLSPSARATRGLTANGTGTSDPS